MLELKVPDSFAITSGTFIQNAKSPRGPRQHGKRLGFGLKCDSTQDAKYKRENQIQFAFDWGTSAEARNGIRIDASDVLLT